VFSLRPARSRVGFSSARRIATAAVHAGNSLNVHSINSLTNPLSQAFVPPSAEKVMPRQECLKLTQTMVIRLDGNGPGGQGLEPLDLDPADFQSPLPVQHVHEYFRDEVAGLSVGVWDTTTMQEAFGPYPTDEFILVLQGAFAMVDALGGSVSARAGDSVTFRNGTPTSWKQDGYLRKIYLTLRAPGSDTPGIASAEGGVTILAKPSRADEVVFRNDSGNMTVSFLAADSIGGPFATTDAHELLQILDGEVEITEPSGATQTFAAGEVAFIPQGTVCALSARPGFTAWKVRVEQRAAQSGDMS
jgi:uncharacterized cupin superfamily protein